MPPSSMFSANPTMQCQEEEQLPMQQLTNRWFCNCQDMKKKTLWMWYVPWWSEVATLVSWLAEWVLWCRTKLEGGKWARHEKRANIKDQGLSSLVRASGRTLEKKLKAKSPSSQYVWTNNLRIWTTSFFKGKNCFIQTAGEGQTLKVQMSNVGTLLHLILLHSSCHHVLLIPDTHRTGLSSACSFSAWWGTRRSSARPRLTRTRTRPALAWLCPLSGFVTTQKHWSSSEVSASWSWRECHKSSSSSLLFSL